MSVEILFTLVARADHQHQSDTPYNRPMRFATRQQLLSWIACLAILMGALMPAISHALQAGGSAPWSDICSASTARNADGKKTPGQALAKHCPLCAVHSSDLAPPPSPPKTVFMALPFLEQPTLFLAAPCTPHAWVNANPRAPPLFV